MHTNTRTRKQDRNACVMEGSTWVGACTYTYVCMYTFMQIRVYFPAAGPEQRREREREMCADVSCEGSTDAQGKKGIQQDEEEIVEALCAAWSGIRGLCASRCPCLSSIHVCRMCARRHACISIYICLCVCLSLCVCVILCAGAHRYQR